MSLANDDVSLDGSVDSYGSFAGSLAGSVNTIEEESDSDYFIPKVCILRADGASLSDIYRSKQQDTWGKIVKAQYKEEQYMNTLKKKQKEYDNDRFGTLLKQQINENNNRIKAETTQNNVFAKLEDERAKRTEDLQKKRTQDAINRHKQFIANALEDMETKRKQKEQEMIKDMMENTRMINKDNQSVVQEHEKKKRMMEYNRQYQERLYQENLDAIARKERQKREYAEEIKRIDQENERQFQREQQRRQQEFNNKMAKSTEGPAHHIVNQITEQKRQKELAYEQYLISKENGLSSQLLLSETKAKQRAESNAHGLSDEWERNKIIKEKKKKDDEERNRKILQTMKEMLDRQEREDIEKRVRKRKENLKYQQDLDQQLAEVRQRSVNSLQKTMSEAERQYNAALIAKMAQFETI